MDAVLVTSVLVIFAGGFSASGYVPLAPFLASRSGVGILLSVQGLASCIALVPSGRAVDRFGSEHILRKGFVVFALSLLFASISTSFAAQLMGRIASGAGGAMLFSSGMAMIMERFQDPTRSEYVGNSIGMGTLGNLAGPPVAGYIYAFATESGVGEPQALALLPAGVLLGLACLAFQRVPKVDFSSKVPLLEEKQSQEGLLLRFFGVYAVVGVRSWVISFALSCLFGAQTALLCAGALEMQAHGFTTREIGLIPVPAGILQAIMSRWGGRMAGTPWRRIYIMILSPLALAVSLLCCSALSSFYPAGGVTLPIVLALGAGSATMAVADAPSISLMSDLAVQHGRGYGEAMTASELAVTAGQAMGPSLAVLMLQQGGFDGLCLFFAACAVLVSCACAAFLRHVEHVEDAPQGTA